MALLGKKGGSCLDNILHFAKARLWVIGIMGLR
jgi:hypothetical protein